MASWQEKRFSPEGDVLEESEGFVFLAWNGETSDHIQRHTTIWGTLSSRRARYSPADIQEYGEAEVEGEPGRVVAIQLQRLTSQIWSLDSI